MKKAVYISSIAGLILAVWCALAWAVGQLPALTELKQGFAAHRVGDRKTALEHYARAIKQKHQLEPEQRVEAYRLRAAVYKELNKYSEGVRDYDQALQLAQRILSKIRLAQLYAGRGAIYLSWRKRQAALDDFNRAQKLAPGLSRIYYYRGSAYQSLRQHHKALADLTTAIRLERVHYYFWTRSKIYMSLRNRQAAIMDMEMALRLKPGRKVYINRLKYLRLLENGDKGS